MHHGGRPAIKHKNKDNCHFLEEQQSSSQSSSNGWSASDSESEGNVSSSSSNSSSEDGKDFMKKMHEMNKSLKNDAKAQMLQNAN